MNKKKLNHDKTWTEPKKNPFYWTWFLITFFFGLITLAPNIRSTEDN